MFEYFTSCCSKPSLTFKIPMRSFYCLFYLQSLGCLQNKEICVQFYLRTYPSLAAYRLYISTTRNWASEHSTTKLHISRLIHIASFQGLKTLSGPKPDRIFHVQQTPSVPGRPQKPGENITSINTEYLHLAAHYPSSHRVTDYYYLSY